MGAAKSSLAWHGSTLIRRVSGIVARSVAGPVVLVRSPGQSLPLLPASFEVLEDLEKARGPLAGLSAGLEALSGRCEIAYVSSTDVPFLHPAFVRHVLAELDSENDACVPCVGGFRQLLAAAYRTRLAPVVKSLVSSDRLRVALVLEACTWKEIDEAALLRDPLVARFDPRLESVTNLNSPEDYSAAKEHAEPLVQVRLLGDGRPDKPGLSAMVVVRETTARAAILSRAAEAIGVSLRDGPLVAVSGFETAPDPEEPLAEGDVVSFTMAGGAQ